MPSSAGELDVNTIGDESQDQPEEIAPSQDGRCPRCGCPVEDVPAVDFRHELLKLVLHSILAVLITWISVDIMTKDFVRKYLREVSFVCSFVFCFSYFYSLRENIRKFIYYACFVNGIQGYSEYLLVLFESTNAEYQENAHLFVNLCPQELQEMFQSDTC